MAYTHVVLKAWSPDQQYQHHLANYWKCQVSGPTWEILNQRFWNREQQSVFEQGLQGTPVYTKVSKPQAWIIFSQWLWQFDISICVTVTWFLSYLPFSHPRLLFPTFSSHLHTHTPTHTHTHTHTPHMHSGTTHLNFNFPCIKYASICLQKKLIDSPQLSSWSGPQPNPIGFQENPVSPNERKWYLISPYEQTQITSVARKSSYFDES